MPEVESKPALTEHKSFWSTAPGLLTAVGGVVTAIATLLTALVAAGVIAREKPTPTVVAGAPVPTAIVAPATIAPATAAAMPATATAALVAPASGTPTPASAVLFADDFSDTRNDWAVSVEPELELGYADGEFTISVYEKNTAAWSYPELPRSLMDYVLEVDARRVRGPADNEYGVMVRYQEATDDFYLFAVSSDGMYAVEQYRSGEWRMLVKWAESAAVAEGAEVNHLRVVCQGTKMRFFVNGELLAEVDDGSFGAGNIGLLASSTDQAGVVVAFDNLRVRALTVP